MRQCSEKGLALIMAWEGLRLEAYLCPVGVWTIGYGHTKGVKKGQRITKEQALAFLREDAQECADVIHKLVKVAITQGQFDALCSFIYNFGETKFSTSALLRLLNKGDYEGARKEFPKWNKGVVKGVLTPMEGLIRRRKAEADMFAL